MKAYLLESPRELRLAEVDVPRIEKGQVLLRTRRVSICVSDVGYYRGGSTPPRWPVIPCHEYMGEVVESRSDDVKVGDRMVYWGETEFGGLAEYRAIKPIFPHTTDDVPWRDQRGFYDASGAAAVLIDPRLPEDTATLIEPLCSVLRTLLHCPPKPGDTAVVIGAGPIGLLAVQLFKRYHACSSVTVLERSPAKLSLARQFGADLAFHVEEDREAIERLIQDSDGCHAQYVFDTLGYAEGEVRTHAMELLEHHGTYIVFASTERPQPFNTWPILAKGLQIRSVAFDVRAMPMRRSASAIALAHRLLLHGMISVEGFISTQIDFLDVEGVRGGFERYAQDGALKTLIRYA